MRIAILNWSGRAVGGTEVYLGKVGHALAAAGHDVAYWFERDAPTDRESITLPAEAPAWIAECDGLETALGHLRGWRPDLLYAHGLEEVAVERATLAIAPAVFFAHIYYGTCIAGTKTLRWPRVQPCEHPFGPRCLVRYYPRHIGGWNPHTAWRQYRRQHARLALLRSYRAIVTHSAHMRAEYLRHQFDPAAVHNVPYLVHEGVSVADPIRPPGDRWRVVFAGRMDQLKGGALLLDAAREAAHRVSRPLDLVFVGDGPDRRAWERKARAIVDPDRLAVDFTGWLGPAALEDVWNNADLLAVPSQWPEPFGRVGPEAGRFGVPAVAFPLGGITEWLTDGVNGHLARSPTSAALADAMVRALDHPTHHAALRRGAASMAAQFDTHHHLEGLLPILRKAARD